MRTVTVTAGPLDAAAFAPFGWLPRDDTDPADGTDTLEFAWVDQHCNVIAHAPDEVERTAEGALVCDRLYRHDTHTQVLMPMNVPAVVAVAPAELALDRPEDVEAVRAFVVQPLEVFVLHRGTWHWGPHPLGDEPVRLLNVQGRRYLEDNRMADLAVTGAVIGVLPGA